MTEWALLQGPITRFLLLSLGTHSTGDPMGRGYGIHLANVALGTY